MKAGGKRVRRWRHPVRDISLAVVGLVVAAIGSVVVWAFTAEAGGSEASVAAMEELVGAYQPGAPLGPEAASGSGGGAGEGAALHEVENAWEHLSDAIARFENAVVPLATPAAAGGAPVNLDFDLLRDGFERERAGLGPAEAPGYAGRVADLEARRGAALSAVRVLEASGLGGSLEQVAGTPGGWRGAYESPFYFFVLPELGQARRMGKYLAARMRLAGATGDTATVVECFEQTLAIARVLSFQAFAIERMVAVDVAGMALAEARLYASTGSLSADDARRILAIMDEQLAWPGVRLQIEGSRLMALDLVRHTHSAGGLMPGRLMYAHYEGLISGGTPAQGLSSIKNVAGLAMPSRAETERAVDTMHDGFLTEVGLNPRQRAEHGFDMEGFVAGLPARQLVVRRVADAGIEPLLMAQDVLEAVAGLTRVRLALLMHQQTRGAYPGGLEELVPEFLAEMPRDPLADDGRFVYRVEGTGFVLLSVGWDGVEDGVDGGMEAFEAGAEGDFVVRVGG